MGEHSWLCQVSYIKPLTYRYEFNSMLGVTKLQIDRYQSGVK